MNGQHTFGDVGVAGSSKIAPVLNGSSALESHQVLEIEWVCSFAVLQS